LPNETEPIAHDSVKRLLERQPHHTEALYNEAKRLIRHNEDVLVIDDSTLDKPYSHQIVLVTRHWSGKHHRVVQGINLISTIWTDGSGIVPVDFRIYHPDTDGKNKFFPASGYYSTFSQHYGDFPPGAVPPAYYLSRWSNTVYYS
jgi:hypothetical protein